MAQLYYTSCERGLRGSPGFQFNAVTPGVPPEVMRDVEALIGYDPPKSVSYDASAEELARCPVNLCHRPGVHTVLARVAFVGADYSRRFGNYFGHALVTSSVERDLGDVLPIELWRASFWTSREARDTTLAPLPAPPPRGPLTVASVQSFLSSRGDGHLAAMLTAVERAVVERERKVVIVAPDADTVAYWIAAVSYLLPVDIVRRMSFATYRYAPRYSPFEVVGTLPDTEVDRSDSAFESQFLFDVVADRHSGIEVHPLARLLADVGVDRSRELWQHARGLATGGEDTLDDWEPVVMAAALRQGEPASVDARTVPVWLAGNAGTLGRAVLEQIGIPLLDHLDARSASDALARLAAAAHTVGAEALVERIEGAWIDMMLTEVVPAGNPVPAETLPIRTPSGRAHAETTLGRELHRATPPAAIALLDWARHSGTPVSSETLHMAGASAVGPELLRRGNETELLALVRAWPAVRDGVVEHLGAEADRQPDRVMEAWLAGLGDVLGAIDTRTPAMVELLEVIKARSGETPAVSAFIAIARARMDFNRHDPDDGLLRRLWPTGGWSHDETATLLGALDPALVVKPPVIVWIDAAVSTDPAPGDPTDYDRLCERLRESPAFDQLPRPARELIDAHFEATVTIDRLVDLTSNDEFDEALDEVVERCKQRPSVRRTAIERRFLDRRRRLDVERLAVVLVRSGGLRKCLVEDAGPSLRRSTPGIEVAVQLLAVIWYLQRFPDDGQARRARNHIADVALPALATWGRGDLSKVSSALADNAGRDAAQWFSGWRKEHAGNPVVRFVRSRFFDTAPEPQPRGATKRGARSRRRSSR